MRTALVRWNDRRSLCASTRFAPQNGAGCHFVLFGSCAGLQPRQLSVPHSHLRFRWTKSILSPLVLSRGFPGRTLRLLAAFSTRSGLVGDALPLASPFCAPVPSASPTMAMMVLFGTVRWDSSSCVPPPLGREGSQGLVSKIHSQRAHWMFCHHKLRCDLAQAATNRRGLSTVFKCPSQNHTSPHPPARRSPFTTSEHSRA